MAAAAREADPYDDFENQSLPGDDHTELWTASDGTKHYISHPYELGLETLRGIVAACDRHGLDVHIDSLSWYFPGYTLRVVYARAQAVADDASERSRNGAAEDALMSQSGEG